jgi:hypothetical protein
MESRRRTPGKISVAGAKLRLRVPYGRDPTAGPARMVAIPIRHASRSLRRTPAFTPTAILTLVIGMGAVLERQ